MFEATPRINEEWIKGNGYQVFAPTIIEQTYMLDLFDNECTWDCMVNCLIKM